MDWRLDATDKLASTVNEGRVGVFSEMSHNWRQAAQLQQGGRRLHGGVGNCLTPQGDAQPRQ